MKCFKCKSKMKQLYPKRIVDNYYALVTFRYYKCEKCGALLIHDPKDIPKEWIGWVICGHSHDHPKSKCSICGGTNLGSGPTGTS